LDAIGEVEGHPVHGRLHSLPADEYSFRCGASGVEIRGILRDTALFGYSLTFERVIRAVDGGTGARIEISDTVRNTGARDAEYALMYHFNFGRPFVGAGTTLTGDIAGSFAVTPGADLKNAFIMGAPAADRQEDFCHEMRAGLAKIANRAGQEAVLAFDSKILTHINEWKCATPTEYSLSVEPVTAPTFGKPSYRKISAGGADAVSVSVEFRNF
jgi:hypothetical protein